MHSILYPKNFSTSKRILFPMYKKLLYWVNQKIHSGFFITSYGKPQLNFLTNSTYLCSLQMCKCVCFLCYIQDKAGIKRKHCILSYWSYSISLIKIGLYIGKVVFFFPTLHFKMTLSSKLLFIIFSIEIYITWDMTIKY